MRQINLLPWREQRRAREKKAFLTLLLVSAFCAVVIVFFINYYAKYLLDEQMARNQILQKEISFLDIQLKEIKKLKLSRKILISRMSMVNHLQSTRTLIIHLLDELSKVMPSGVYLAKLERQNDLVSLWGYAKSNTQVSDLMKKIVKNKWMQTPVLSEIKKMQTKTQSAANEFKLNFVLKPIDLIGTE